jgi:hypothetical protein
MSPTTGKPNVWLSGLLGAPSLHPRQTYRPGARRQWQGENLAYAQERDQCMLDRDAPPIP